MPIKEQNFQQQKLSYPTQNKQYWNRRVPETEEDNPGLGNVFAVLRRKVAVIGSVAIIVSTAAAAWTSTRTPEYEGKFQLLVEPLKTSESELLLLLSETLKENVNEITKQNKTELDYQALMEVLRSPNIIAPVVSKLQTKYPDIRYEKLVGNDLPKPVPGRLGTLYITRISKGKEESRVIEVRYRDSNPEKIQLVLDQVSQAYRHYSREQQETNLTRGIKFVEEQVPKLRVRVNTLQQQLQSFQQQHAVFDPELQGGQLLKRDDTIKTQITDTERKLAESKSLYASLQKQLGMQQNQAIAASALSESPQYQQILSRVREVEAKIATESARFQLNSPIIQSLQDQRNKLLPLLNREAKNALGNNGLNARSVPQVDTVRRDLIQQLADAANQVHLLETSLQANRQAEQQLSQEIKEYPSISRQYTNMQRDLRVASDTLTQILAKKEALRVDAAQQEVPWELIMPPTIPRDLAGRFKAVSPDHKRDVLLGGVAGLLLGILAAFMLENWEKIFHDIEEVKRETKLSLLGVIPFDKELQKRASSEVGYLSRQRTSPKATKRAYNNVDTAVKVQQEEAFPFVLAFYSLFNKIQSLSYEIPIRSIAITSATSGIGKSTIAENLARIAAETGKKVLVVDANLRNPQLHNNLNMVNTKGLSEVLTDGLTLNDVTGKSHLEDNLFVVTGGSLAAGNPTKLFSSKRMQRFVEEAHEEFDLVIYDTTHLIGYLDTHVLTQYVDALILVLGVAKTTRPSFQEALDQLQSSRLPVLGVVANYLK
jgi:succinoglycan biosynthesis transport protein ExoP